MNRTTIAIATVIVAGAALAGCTGGAQSDAADRDAQIQRNVQALRNARQVSNELPRVDAPAPEATPDNGAAPAPR